LAALLGWAGNLWVYAAEEHAAFLPLQRPQVPEVRDPEQARTPVDRFIQGKLAGLGLSIGPEAERETLIRRVSFLVTGLPPSPEEVDVFLADRGPGAYERMVEGYLASRGFGERWGKLWLDAAGYADSNGYFSADTDRPLAFRYPDYVVRSLNQDKPFDRFVREQIAGDEGAGWRPGQPVTPEIIEQLEATHFLRNGQDGSGESDGNPDEVRVDRYYALESSMQVIGSCLLGVTLQCAKCHEHKFEPIRQEDYYNFQAFLYPAFHIEKWVKPNDRVVMAALPGEQEAWEANEKILDARKAAALAGFNAWHAAHRPAGLVLFEDSFEDPQGWMERWSNQAPGDDLPAGNPPVSFDPASAPSASVASGVLRLREGGGSGDRWLSTRRAFSWRPATNGAWIQVTFALKATRLESGDASAERIGYVIGAHDFNDNSTTEGGNILVDGHPGGASQVHVDYPGSDSRSRGEIGGTGYEAGRRYGVRLTRESNEKVLLEHLVDEVPEGKRLHLDAAEVTDGGFGFEFCCGRSFVVDDVRVEASVEKDPAWSDRQSRFRLAESERRVALDTELKAIAAERRPKPGRIAWVSDVVSDLPSVPLLKRGSPKTPGEPVAPAFPGFLGASTAVRQRLESRLLPSGATGTGTASGTSSPKGEGSTGLRRVWAEWLTEPGSRAASLLARVTVNRIWQGYFGEGIVSTPDNLGRSGARPTHPELLEWLASELVDSGWSLKAVHRAILRSAVFRQTSLPTPQALEKDFANRGLSRFPMRRLDAESIRDAMLKVSGRLGGKTSGPYVPTQRNGDGEIVVDEKHPEAFARSVYLQQRRTQVATILGLFDAPSVVFNCTRRPSSTMPLQSLNLLNSDFSLARAGDLASRLRTECGEGDVHRIRRGFRHATGRRPDPVEEKAALEFVRGQREMYAPGDAGERRVWTDFAQSLFALNATLYLE